jgi:hypothetical protein
MRRPYPTVHVEHGSVPFPWGSGSKPTLNRGHLPLNIRPDNSHQTFKLSWTPIRRHVLVKGAASPDDPALRGYWLERERRKIDDDLLPPRLMGLARAQRGLCSHCGESLFNGESLHRHHLLPKSEGGTDKRSNVQLLHLYCHQRIHTPVAPARRPSDAEASCLSRVRGNPQARF